MAMGLNRRPSGASYPEDACLGFGLPEEAERRYAYLKLRLGKLEEGQAALAKLMELDPSDKLGGKVLMNVLSGQTHGLKD